MATTYRAAILFSADRQGTTVLTAPEHAASSDEDLRAEADREMARARIEIGEGSIEIGDWTE